MSRYKIGVQPKTVEASTEREAVEEFMRWLDRVSEDDLVMKVEREDGSARFYLGTEPGGPVEPRLPPPPPEIDVRIPPRLLAFIHRSPEWRAYTEGHNALSVDLPFFAAIARAEPRADGAVVIRANFTLVNSLTWWSEGLMDQRTDVSENDRRANVRSGRAVLRQIVKLTR